MKYTLRIVLFLAMIVATSKSALAANVTFSNIIIEGSLAAGAQHTTNTNGMINFTLPNAKVNDGTHSNPFGNIIISFVAESDTPMNMDELIMNALDLGNAGAILFNETIYDIENPLTPTELVSFSTILNGSSTKSFNTDLDFSTTPSTRILVVKSFTLTALDFGSSDPSFAEIGSVQQTFIPEPATLAFFLGGMALLIYHERRRKGTGRLISH